MKYFRILILTAGLLFPLILGAQSLLWEISGKGLQKPSYLYGTAHLQDKRVFQLNDQLLPALDRVDALALEVIMTEAEEASILEQLQLQDGTLEDVLTAEQYERLSEVFKKETGIGIEAVNNFSLPMISLMLLENRTRKEMPYTVDDFLELQAKERKLELLSLEAFEDQIALLKKIPAEASLAYLFDLDQGDRIVEEIMQAYLAEDVELLHALSTKDPLYAPIMDDFLYRRNEVMAERIDEIAQQKSLFAGVGAAHLGGERGVIARLRKMGYTVVPVKATTYLNPDELTLNDDEGWIRFESPEYPGIRAYFPGEPKMQEFDVETDLGMQKTRIYGYEPPEEESDHRMFALMVTRYNDQLHSDSLSSQDLDEMFEKSKLGMLEKTEGQLITEQRLEYFGYPAREMHVKVMQGVVDLYVRTLLAGDRFIILQAMTIMNAGPESERLNFFNSLEITDQ